MDSRRSTRILYLRDQFRLRPPAFGHLVGRKTLARSAFVALGQVRSGASFELEIFDMLENLHPKSVRPRSEQLSFCNCKIATWSTHLVSCTFAAFAETMVREIVNKPSLPSIDLAIAFQQSGIPDKYNKSAEAT
jgi:hypothetical protein